MPASGMHCVSAKAARARIFADSPCADDRTALTVAPVVPVDTSYVRCIEHSIISARIRSELADSETGMPQFLMPLPPLRFSAAKGEYESALAVPHSLPPGEQRYRSLAAQTSAQTPLQRCLRA